MQNKKVRNVRAKSARQCNYLTQTKTGVYTFRWNIVTNGKHHQPRLSLRTRDYLEAVGIASELARDILEIPTPTIDQVKAVYAQFLETKAEASARLVDVEMERLLADLAVKSQREYLSVWKSFLGNVDVKSLSCSSVSMSHIHAWKQAQTCSEVTLKKKLRLLSSCFTRAGVAAESDWFRVKIKQKNNSQRRAFTKTEASLLFKSTASHQYEENCWRYYLPRLALLTGCRLNELAQLRVEDIDLGESPSISINNNGSDKKLKNESSVRMLPLTGLATELIKELIGLKGSSQRLFSELTYSEANGYASKPSKYFSRLSKELFGEEKVSFHSFRHLVITHLFNSGIKEELIGCLMGHSVGRLTTGKVYLSGFNYRTKLEAMEYMSSLFNSLEDFKVGR